MDTEVIVSSRSDRELRKKIIKHGNYELVPFEESRCKVILTDIHSTIDNGDFQIDKSSKVLNPSFNGIILIGDSDNFIDKDFELILQQMCEGEVCSATMSYKNSKGELVKKISCTIELKETMEEQIISEWSWLRLLEAAYHHKDRGVELVHEKRMLEAFRRFNKALKMLIFTEPLDPDKVTEGKAREMIELRVKIYNNLAHCQLHYNEYDAALELCNKALKFEVHDAVNVKTLYRRSCAYIGLNMFEEAWKDIQSILKKDPKNKAALQKVTFLKPKLEHMNEEYSKVIKKMFPG